MSPAKLRALFDAKDACLRRVAERRTRGRMKLYAAVDELLAFVLLAKHAKAVR